MANSFTRFPVTGGDNGVWGPLLLANLRDLIGLNSCKLYDDSGVLKVSQGKIGINDNTNEGIMTIDTITTISIAGVSNSNWAQIEIGLSGGVPVFSATDIAGATDSDFLPSTLTDAYSGTKDGFYINATKRTIGAVYKDGSGNLAFVVNCNIGGEQIIGDKFHSVNDILIRTPKAKFSKFSQGNVAGVTGAWTTCTLNTEDYNFIEGASLASNQITLPVGKYIVYARHYFYLMGSSFLRLRNITDGSTIIMGGGAYSSNVDATLDNAILNNYFELTASKVIELQYWGTTAGLIELNSSGGVGNFEQRFILIEKVG